MVEMHTKLAAVVEEAARSADNRRHKRIRLPLNLRYMLPDQSEHTGKIINISAGGALIKAEPGAAQGDKVVLYIRQLGRYEGEVVRIERDGFAVKFKTKRKRQQRMADSLVWLFNDGEKYLNRRSAQRIRQDRPATVIFADGSKAAGRILDISVTGASVSVTPKPPVGQNIIIGRMAGKVVRHHSEGIGVEFNSPQPNLN